MVTVSMLILCEQTGDCLRMDSDSVRVFYGQRSLSDKSRSSELRFIVRVIP
jgi:hypothetical protein